MEIQKKHQEGALLLQVSGRLDSHWADLLEKELEEAIQQGNHAIRLDLAQVRYLSSAGIRILIRFHRELERIDGSILVANPSQAVREILKISGLLDVFLVDAARSEEPVQPAASAKELERDGVRLEVYGDPSDGALTCRVIGDSTRLQTGWFGEQDCRTVTLEDSTFGLGIGALGDGFEASRDRFGEFLAVSGAAIYQPADGTGTPDYLVSGGDYLPEVSLLCGLLCDGDFSQLVRFETTEEGPVGLSSLADMCLEVASAEAIGMVVVCESSGLMGASLKRSPARQDADGVLFDHPGVRQWMSFHGQQVHASSLTIAVGVVAGAEQGPLKDAVRPLGASAFPAGHFHAAAFSYSPLKRGEIDLRETVAGIFDSERAEGVVHLLNDDRPVLGVGESEFTRGACWMGPIAGIESI